MTQELWKDIPNYEGIYQLSNKKRVRSVERLIRSGYNHQVKRVVPSKILKLTTYKRSGKLVANVVHNRQNITFDVNALAQKLFPNENPQLSLELFPKMSSNTFSEEIMSIVNNWDSYTPAQIKSKLNELANIKIETKIVDVSTEQVQSLRSQVMSVFDNFLSKSDSKNTESSVKAMNNETVSSEEEIWKAIKDTDNKYFVSNKGGFKILKDGKYIYPKGCLKKTSIVYRVVINGKATNRSLAQLVLNTFNDTNFTGRVIYKNGNFKDCSLNNLEWLEKGVSKTC